MKTKFLNIFLLLSLSVSIISCDKDKDKDKDEDEVPAPVETVQKIKLNIDHKMGADNFNYTTILTDKNGTKFQIDAIQMYFSAFAAQNTSIASSVLFVKPEVSSYTVGNIPAGDYPGLRFSVGVPANLNTQAGADAKDITEYSSGHPLSFQVPSMHWSWNTGYIFLRIDGRYDSTGDNTPNENFRLHVGNNPNLAELHFPGAYTVSPSTDKVLNFEIDYVEFFDDLDLLTENTLHGNSTLATKIVGNYAKAIKRK
jgi:hypothetical protein